ncbi:hypothetical protein EWM64_g478 [Hericium alpestre]|uniref:AB hydrolase-1 domain-containing protein n=1 Tax=Hericium alpestre TaxID=135208 RepID=A0A4Z0A8Z3_9AGAM|nr:hypothetical protein EWM64_g478 [Hericium alpestre]
MMPTKSTRYDSGQIPPADAEHGYSFKVHRRPYWLAYGIPLLAICALFTFRCSLPGRQSVRGFWTVVTQDSDSVVGTVKWYKCTEPGSVPGSECGHVIVPLDYLNSSAGTAKVALARYKATKGPSKGSVLLNPGGPGGAGTVLAYRMGPVFQTIATGEDWDLVGFDPRGIGRTEPKVNCFGTSARQAMFQRNTVLDRGFQVAPKGSGLDRREHLIQQYQEADALYQTQFALCEQEMGDSLRYMGTSTVVRDIDFITRALDGEEALINFWGGSYGSILGQYLVNMLPDRVGRVVIDGIADAPMWASEPPYKWYRQWLSNTEDAYQIFLDGCAKAGPSKCKLAKNAGEDPEDIKQRLETWMQGLFSRPLPVPTTPFASILTEGQARTFVFSTLQRPMLWEAHAEILFDAMNGNATALLGSPQPSLFPDLVRSGVSCNDQSRFGKLDAKDVIDEALYVMENVTHFVMSVFTTEPDSGCEYWPVDPPERFAGPWNQTLRNLILIHSNTADPVTPIASGRHVRELLGLNSSRLAIQDSPGHCSVSAQSVCTVNITRAYFKDGSLPPDGHICPVDIKPFEGKDELRSYSAEESKILAHLKMVATYFGQMGDLRQSGEPF